MDRFTGNMNLNAGCSAIFPRGSSDDQDAEIFDQVQRVEYEMLRVSLDGSTASTILLPQYTLLHGGAPDPVHLLRRRRRDIRCSINAIYSVILGDSWFPRLEGGGLRRVIFPRIVRVYIYTGGMHILFDPQ